MAKAAPKSVSNLAKNITIGKTSSGTSTDTLHGVTREQFNSYQEVLFGKIDTLNTTVSNILDFSKDQAAKAQEMREEGKAEREQEKGKEQGKDKSKKTDVEKMKDIGGLGLAAIVGGAAAYFLPQIEKLGEELYESVLKMFGFESDGEDKEEPEKDLEEADDMAKDIAFMADEEEPEEEPKETPEPAPTAPPSPPAPEPAPAAPTSMAEPTGRSPEPQMAPTPASTPTPAPAPTPAPTAPSTLAPAPSKQAGGTPERTGPSSLSNEQMDSNKKQLLDFIAKYEGGKEGYNALVYGKGTPASAPLTDMTIQEVFDYQKQMVNRGHASSAVGRYQFINKTLKGLVQKSGISTSEKFTPEIQDKLAGMLLDEAGYKKMIRGEITQDEFQNRLANIWASLPRTDGTSQYAGIAGNKVGVSSAALNAIIASTASTAVASNIPPPPGAMPTSGGTTNVQTIDASRTSIAKTQTAQAKTPVNPGLNARNPDPTVSAHDGLSQGATNQQA